MHGDATLRPVWHTFRVDASFDKQQGITGIGLILRATNKAGRDGAVVARFSESYIGLPIQAGEQFAVLRALDESDSTRDEVGQHGIPRSPGN